MVSMSESALTLCRQVRLMRLVCRKYHSFIPLLAEMARVAVKEKVVRVVLATFRVCLHQFLLWIKWSHRSPCRTQNLTTLAPQENLPAMLSAKLLPYLQSVSNSRRWSDEEVKEDAAYLKEQLQSLKKGLTCVTVFIPQ